MSKSLNDLKQLKALMREKRTVIKELNDKAISLDRQVEENKQLLSQLKMQLLSAQQHAQSNNNSINTNLIQQTDYVQSLLSQVEQLSEKRTTMTLMVDELLFKNKQLENEIALRELEFH